MVKLRHRIFKLFLLSTTLAIGAFAQTSLTAIRDTVYNTDGSLFNGTVVIAWNSSTAPSGGTVAPHGTSAHIYNGVLSVLLVPSTTTAGAYYSATYNSNDGTVTWTETWNVPPSTTPLTLAQVKSTGTGGGGTGGGGTGGGGVTLPIQITDVTGLSSALSGLTTSVASVTSTLNTVSSNLTSLTSTVNSLSATVTNVTASPAFVDGETPAGTINGTNTTFTLAKTPAPATSLEVYRNGLVQTVGVDYTLSASTVSFLSVATPQTGDVLQAYYRVAGSGPAAQFADGETPGGTMNGVNTTFTLVNAPNPVLGLKLFRNGLLLRQSVDYTLSGATITFFNSNAAPKQGDSVLAYYRF